MQKYFLKVLLVLFSVMISVAFFTLLERKILGYSHERFGPNKIFIFGLFQPFSDALKLFMKLDFKLSEVSFLCWFIMPTFMLILSVFLWGFFPFWGLMMFSKFSFLLLILLGGLSVYFFLYTGWSTTTKYSLLGSYRSSSQSVSYEVLMIICFLVLIYWWFDVNFIHSFTFLLVVGGLVFLSLPLSVCWFLSCVAECNRSPFDFSEGESELVSGFNTEYGGGLFSLIFIAEYSSILFLSLVTSFLLSSSLIFLFFVLLSFFYLWVRCSFPRLRYDLLMMMAWKGLLFYLMGVFFLSYFFLL